MGNLIQQVMRPTQVDSMGVSSNIQAQSTTPHQIYNVRILYFIPFRMLKFDQKKKVSLCFKNLSLCINENTFNCITSNEFYLLVLTV